MGDRMDSSSREGDREGEDWRIDEDDERWIWTIFDVVSGGWVDM